MTESTDSHIGCLKHSHMVRPHWIACPVFKVLVPDMRSVEDKVTRVFLRNQQLFVRSLTSWEYMDAQISDSGSVNEK